MKVYAVKYGVNTDEVVGHLLALDDEGYSNLILDVNQKRKEAELKQCPGRIYTRDSEGATYFFAPTKVIGDSVLELSGTYYKFTIGGLSISECARVKDISIWTPVVSFVLAAKILRILGNDVSLVQR